MTKTKTVNLNPVDRKSKKETHYINNEDFYKSLVKRSEEIKLIRSNDTDLSVTKADYPKVSEYIGKCFVMIANKLSGSPNFRNYSYRDEMISDGIEDCILRIDSFDVDKALWKIYQDGKEVFKANAIQEISDWFKTNKNIDISISDIQDKSGYTQSGEIEVSKECVIKFNRNPFAYFTQLCWFAAVRRIKQEQKQRDIKGSVISNSGIMDVINEQQEHDSENYQNGYLEFLQDNFSVGPNASDDTDLEEKTKIKFVRRTKLMQRKIEELEERENKTVDNYHEELDNSANIISEEFDDMTGGLFDDSELFE